MSHSWQSLSVPMSNKNTNKKLTVDLVRMPLWNLGSAQSLEPDATQIVLAHKYAYEDDAMNMIPIVVKKVGTQDNESYDQNRYHYEVIDGHHIFHALQQAQCTWAMCLRLSEAESASELWKVELGIATPKLNLCSVRPKDLQHYLEQIKPKEKNLSRLKVDSLVKKLAEHPDHVYWESLDRLKSLKVGIGPKTLRTLAKYLSVEPEPPEPLEKLCINTASYEDLQQRLQQIKHREKKLYKLNIDKLVKKLAEDPNRGCWESLDRLELLRVGIGKKTLPLLAKYLSVEH